MLFAILVGFVVHEKPSDPELKLTQAVFARSDVSRVPANLAEVGQLEKSQSVELPHEWRRDYPALWQGWYFVAFDVKPGAGEWAVLWIPRVAMNAEVFLNGAPLASRGRMQAPVSRNWNRSWLIPVPASLLKPDNNLLAVRVVGDTPGRGMLREIYFGADAQLRGYFERDNFVSHTLVQMIVLLMVLTSIFMALLWYWGRGDSRYGWYSVMLVAWAVHDFYPYIRTPALSPAVLYWFWHASLVWFIYSLCMFVSRYLHITEKTLEKRLLIWAALTSFALALLAALAPAPVFQVGVLISDTIALTVAAYPFICVMTSLVRRFAPEIAMLVFAGAFALSFGIHDWMIMAGVLERSNNLLMPYGSLSIMLVIGLLLVRAFGTAHVALEALNKTLEQRVHDRELEIERAHDRLLKLETERVIASERERLVRDMHDGLGGTLISTLAMVRSGSMKPGSLEESLQAAIEDMRLMIDSLDPVDGDLVSVLANLRARLAPRLEAAGLAVRWKVTDLPAMGWLGPQGVLGVMRILQEGINNVLKHAQAGTIEVGCGLDEASGKVWVRLADNGVGLRDAGAVGKSADIASISGGRGLSNMKQRAAELGGSLEVRPAKDGGTEILLLLPIQLCPEPERA